MSTPSEEDLARWIGLGDDKIKKLILLLILQERLRQEYEAMSGIATEGGSQYSQKPNS
jgi:hypothetical protein